MRTPRILTVSLLAACSVSVCSCGGRKSAAGPPYYIDIRDKGQLFEYFRYDPGKPVIISGHRGGMTTGYPENCIESFEKSLSLIESFFEVDPRFTRDSVIVLMHDHTLDRTTDAKGLVTDYTYEELKKVNLVDLEGNPTPFKIPTLEEVIKWSQGKTILNLDIKDVPLDYMAKYVAQFNVPNIMFTVHNPQHALTCLRHDKQAGLILHCKTMEEFEAYRAADIPWSQVMVYIGHTVRPEQQALYDKLHELGISYMISVAPTQDKKETYEQKMAGYRQEISTKPDIIETDYPSLFVGLDLSK